MKKDCRKLKEDKKKKEDGAMVAEQEEDYGVLALTACVECAYDRKKGGRKKNNFVDEALLSKEKAQNFDKMDEDTWLIDSGASTHITNSKVGVQQLKNIDKK